MSEHPGRPEHPRRPERPARPGGSGVDEDPLRDARTTGAAGDDRAAAIEAAWHRERPDLDASSVRVVTRVWHLAALLTGHRRRLLHARGLDPALLDLLGTLRRAGEPGALTTRELAARSLVTPAAISQRLTRAEQRGWVTRERATTGRRVLVRLTDAGRETIDGTAGAIFAQERELLAGLPDADRATLAGLLGQLIADVERAGP